MFTVNPHNGHNILSLVEKASPYSTLREVSKLSETPFSQLKPLPYIGKTQPTSIILRRSRFGGCFLPDWSLSEVSKRLGKVPQDMYDTRF